MRVISVAGDKKSLTPTTYYIDCPVDVEMFGAELRRVEIPRELAKYLLRLQELTEKQAKEIAQMEVKIKVLSK